MLGRGRTTGKSKGVLIAGVIITSLPLLRGFSASPSIAVSSWMKSAQDMAVGPCILPRSGGPEPYGDLAFIPFDCHPPPSFGTRKEETLLCRA